MEVCIVIVSYNGMTWLKRCLDSCGNYPVVVVDNASTDDTVTFIETHFPHVALLKQKNNLGFGQANNLGISYALNNGAEYVFLLNQDAYLLGDVLEELVAFQKAHLEYGIVSPVHITPDKKRLDARFSNYLSYRYNPDFYSDFVLGNALKDVYELPFVNAAGWLISKECLLTVGGFDPMFFHYGEDDNYCQRVHFHGLKIGVLPKSYLIHDREDRRIESLALYSPNYFKARLKTYQLKFGNVNHPKALTALDKKILSLKEKSVKSQLLFKKEAKGILKEYRLLKEERQAINESYHTNQKAGSHYLTLEK